MVAASSRYDNCIFVNNQWYDVKDHPSGGSLILGFSKYSGTGKGTYRTLGIGQKIAELGITASHYVSLSADRVKDLTYLSSWFALCRSPLIFFKLTSNTIIEFGRNAYKSGCFPDREKFAELVYAFIDMTNDLIVFLDLFRIPEMGKFLLKRTGASLSFIKDTWDLKKNWDEYHLCSDIDSKALSPGEVQDADISNKFHQYTVERKRYLAMSAIADLVDYFLVLQIFAGFALGVATLPVVALGVIGTASFFIKYASDVYEESMTYKLEKLPPPAPEVEEEAVS